VSNSSLFVESTASLAQWVKGSGTTTVTGADSTGVLNATNFAKWWVFLVDSAISGDSAANHVHGYFVLERTEVKDNAGVVTSRGIGQSAWVWKTSSSKWTASEQQVQDGAANAKGIFSDIAVRDTSSADNFAINGTVETGTDAAWFGAPEVADGTFDAMVNAISLSYDASLSWDADNVTKFVGYTDFVSVVNALENAAAAVAAEIAGE